MQQPERHISSADAPNDNSAEDDIDQLFGNLELVGPPPALIARILAHVSQLSHTEAQKKEPPAAELFENLDNLVVRNEKKEPG